MQPAAIIFDLDGTLIDTEAEWDEVRRGLAADAGLPWPDGSTQAMMGMSTPEWALHLVEVVGLPMTPEDAARLTIEHMARRHETDLKVLPGAVAAVRLLAQEYPMAVASSSPRLLIESAVHALGLDDAFPVRVSTEEVAAGKPAPDGFLRAAELLGVDPTRCVAFEDSTNGIKSALNAGMKVIVVPPHFHRPADELLAQTRVLDSLEDLTLDVIAEL
ncbi:HAD family phosphatase [Tessaracoccus rhinocerotis]|uniref:HAD family phosphatase n=1 Tax=Tessaracoccus rhinocerotis TaxID=1689449 RepID=A0A553K2X3_9ACTN|nr:HAD family phosphatase [Tessaracoccus rhinocerotis]TRY19038.1 HAD family phosphatase [Tessaracoccus rhinocerotis]